MEKSRKLDLAKEKPIEFFVVAKNVETGHEVWYRTAHLQGFSKKLLAAAFAGKIVEGYAWRKVPVRYRFVTDKGQEFEGRWDAGKKGFVADGMDVVFSRKWCKEVEEIFEDGSIPGSAA